MRKIVSFEVATDGYSKILLTEEDTILQLSQDNDQIFLTHEAAAELHEALKEMIREKEQRA